MGGGGGGEHPYKYRRLKYTSMLILKAEDFKTAYFRRLKVGNKARKLRMITSDSFIYGSGCCDPAC